MDSEFAAYDAQRMAFGKLLARFTADRDAIIASIQECEERIAALEQRGSGGAPAASGSPDATSGAALQEFREALGRVSREVEELKARMAESPSPEEASDGKIEQLRSSIEAEIRGLAEELQGTARRVEASEERLRAFEGRLDSLEFGLARLERSVGELDERSGKGKHRELDGRLAAECWSELRSRVEALAAADQWSVLFRRSCAALVAMGSFAALLVLLDFVR